MYSGRSLSLFPRPVRTLLAMRILSSNQDQCSPTCIKLDILVIGIIFTRPGLECARSMEDIRSPLRMLGTDQLLAGPWWPQVEA